MPQYHNANHRVQPQRPPQPDYREDRDRRAGAMPPPNQRQHEHDQRGGPLPDATRRIQSLSEMEASRQQAPKSSAEPSRGGPSQSSYKSPDERYAEEFLFVQKYYGYLKAVPAVQFQEMGRSVGGRTPPMKASLEVPRVSGEPFLMEATGLSKKDARFNLIFAIKERIDREGLLDEYFNQKKGGRRNAPDSKSKGQEKKDSKSRKPDPKYNAPAPPPPAPGDLRALIKRRDPESVPDSWDDDADLPGPNDSRAGSSKQGRSSKVSNSRKNYTSRQDSYGRQQQQPQAPQAMDWWDDDKLAAGTPMEGVQSTSNAGFNDQGGYGGSAPVFEGPPRPDRYSHGVSQGSFFDDSYSYFSNNKNTNNNQRLSSSNQDLYRRGPEPPRSQPPAPRSSTRLPSHIEDVVRKYVNFYCNRFKLPIPSAEPYQQRKMKLSGRGRKVKHVIGDWECRMEVDRHVTLDGTEAGPIVGLGHGKNKKETIPKAWEDLCSRLLVLSPQPLVDQFISLATPFKKRLADMLSSPIRIDISEAAAARLESVISDLRNLDAFRIPSDSSESSSAPLLLGGSSLDGHIPPPLNFVRSSDLRTPAALDKSRDLPMYNYYAKVIASIENNPVTILSAETGAGKTTQLPQFLLERHLELQRKDPSIPPLKVIVTQPRRIAAISVATRVAQERGETLGRNSAIGYQVRFEEMRPKSDPRDGHVVFCTSGILLRRFQDDPMLEGVTHIILDEVHERDLNTDLLLIITRHLLQRRPDIKIVLMSATAETSLFADYFRGYGFEGPRGVHPPIVSVPGRLYPVKEYYLEDVADIVERDMRVRVCDDTYSFLRSELGSSYPPASVRGEEFPYDLFEALITYITTSKPEGAILVFLPGWQEINTLQTKLKEDDVFKVGYGDPNKCKVYPLHSSVPTAGQQEVFDRPPPGVRKIILSTNIAETSVTINDIVYVIDSGKIRINSYDSNSRISSLNSVWAAQSNIKQRCGRAGRCQPGQYYSLLSERRRRGLPYSMPPELLRVDLQSTALKIKALRIANSVAEVFAQSPEPPPPMNVNQALRELRALGAFDYSENLTPLGRVLADLPVDPWVGKMVLEGAIYGCLDSILTVAGAMEIGRGIYAIHPDDKQRARQHILTNFAAGTDSDQLTMLVAFKAWKKAGSTREFASSNFLHGTSLLNIDRAKQQLLRVLEDGGFLDRRSIASRTSRSYLGRGEWNIEGLMGGTEANLYSGDMAMVRAILCGALFPNVAEVTGKDEYRSSTDYKLRLTGGSVCSWRGLLGSAGVADALNAPSGTTSSQQQLDKPSDAGSPLRRIGSSASLSNIAPSRKSGYQSDILDFPDDLDDTSAQVPEFFGAPLPPRLLCYQDKQRVDGGLYLRSTTKADPLALLLLAPAESESRSSNAASLPWSRLEGKPAAVLANWIRVQVPDEYRARIIDETRTWLARFLDWSIWRNTSRKHKRFDAGSEEDRSKDEEAERLGKSLLKEVVGIIGSSA
ncbi:hypothetical protein HDV05_002253 [Chytridiales sp. JEL 0842]|nr:hypothetical protein HDV05_002253 [Chytridiales sp. JEL 0842]